MNYSIILTLIQIYSLNHSILLVSIILCILIYIIIFEPKSLYTMLIMSFICQAHLQAVKESLFIYFMEFLFISDFIKSLISLNSLILCNNSSIFIQNLFAVIISYSSLPASQVNKSTPNSQYGHNLFHTILLNFMDFLMPLTKKNAHNIKSYNIFNLMNMKIISLYALILEYNFECNFYILSLKHSITIINLNLPSKVFKINYKDMARQMIIKSCNINLYLLLNALSHFIAIFIVKTYF